MYFSYVISIKIANKFLSKKYITQNEYAPFIYSISYIMEMMIFFLTATLISFIIHFPFYSVAYFLILFSLRSCCGGYHANSRILCSILTYSFYLLFFLLMTYYPSFYALFSLYFKISYFMKL